MHQDTHAHTGTSTVPHNGSLLDPLRRKRGESSPGRVPSPVRPARPRTGGLNLRDRPWTTTSLLIRSKSPVAPRVKGRLLRGTSVTPTLSLGRDPGCQPSDERDPLEDPRVKGKRRCQRWTHDPAVSHFRPSRKELGPSTLGVVPVTAAFWGPGSPRHTSNLSKYEDASGRCLIQPGTLV